MKVALEMMHRSPNTDSLHYGTRSDCTLNACCPGHVAYQVIDGEWTAELPGHDEDPEALYNAERMHSIL